MFDSKLSYEEWLEGVNLSFKAVNGEEKITPKNGEKFDRIICNLGLHLTEDPAKMLKNFH